jgi:hypothetical protein
LYKELSTRNFLDIRTEEPEAPIPFGSTSEVYFVESESEFKAVKQLLHSMEFVETSAPVRLLQLLEQAKIPCKAYRPSLLREFLKKVVARGLIQDGEIIEDSLFKNKENLDKISTFCMKDLSIFHSPNELVQCTMTCANDASVDCPSCVLYLEK